MLKEIILDALRSVKKFVDENAFGFALALNAFFPYIMFFIGVFANKETNVYLLWLLLPMIVFVLTYVTKQYANRIGKGITVPVPLKRFTEWDDNGMVSIPIERIQELLLYVGDLEDWLQQHGMFNKANVERTLTDKEKRINGRVDKKN